jgi:crotonobetainyl-CoA:carnitine CoA-transferase CaiB-like acyl-CoA transferase
MTRPLPLADVRIIAVEQYGAGPFGSVHLADLGADVIKVEDPRSGGDIGRYIPPYAQDEDSLFFETFNRNKRSISLNLSTPAGREVFEDLVRHSDALYSNLRGDVPAKLGLTYDVLRHVNPRIVCCSLSAYGMTGPRAHEPGYDYVLQGLAGWMALTGEPGGPPEKTGLSLVDFSGGFVAALSLLAGLHAARRDGVGMDCDVSLFDTAIGLLTYLGTWHMSAGHEPVRTSRSAHPSLVPFQNFPTADGWIVVSCPKEQFWQRLARAVGQPQLLEDERFTTFEDRRRNAEALLPVLDACFRSRTTGHWVETLTAAEVPCAPVNDVAQALQDPQTQARGMIVTTQHPTFGVVRQPASPVHAGPPRLLHRRAPRRHEHGEEILRELLGYDDSRRRALGEAGAFG